MPYMVQSLNQIYEEGGVENTNAQDVTKFLNDAETIGYTLVGIVPDHLPWESDDEGPTRVSGAMLVLHKPKKPSQSDCSGLQAEE